MPGATSDAPPEPPAEMMPAILPCRRSQLTKASAMAVTDAPRSAPNTLDPPRPWFRAISCAETSQVEALPLVETSTRRVRRPLFATMSRMKRNSAPLVSSVPTTSTTGGPELWVVSRLAPLSRDLLKSRDAGRDGARGSLDARDRYRLRPARRQHGIGDEDPHRPLAPGGLRRIARFRSCRAGFEALPNRHSVSLPVA